MVSTTGFLCIASHLVAFVRWAGVVGQLRLAPCDAARAPVWKQLVWAVASFAVLLLVPLLLMLMILRPKGKPGILRLDRRIIVHVSVMLVSALAFLIMVAALPVVLIRIDLLGSILVRDGASAGMAWRILLGARALTPGRLLRLAVR